MFPEHNIPLQNAALRSAFCAATEIGPRWVLPSWLWGVARARAGRASSGKVSLLHIGEDVWRWIKVAETTSQAAVPTEPEAAQNLLGPMGSIGLGEN